VTSVQGQKVKGQGHVTRQQQQRYTSSADVVGLSTLNLVEIVTMGYNI